MLPEGAPSREPAPSPGTSRHLVVRSLVIRTRKGGIYLGLANPQVGGRSNIVLRNVVRGNGMDAFQVRKKDRRSVLRHNVARGPQTTD